MVEYTNLKAALNRVSKVVRRESYDTDLLSSMLEGYRGLGFPGKYTNKVVFHTLENGCVQLNADVKYIDVVTYMIQDPREEEYTELCESIEDEEEQTSCADCFTNLSKNCAGFTANFPYMLFLNSALYNNNFFPLRYIKHTKPSNVCKYCINNLFNNCADTYSVDENKILYSSLDEGFICVDYSTEVRDEKGDFIIPNDEKLLKFLARYAEAEHLRNNMHMHEEGAMNVYQMARAEANLAERQAWGSRLLKSLNIMDIMSVTSTGNPHFVMTKLPQIYYKEVPYG